MKKIIVSCCLIIIVFNAMAQRVEMKNLVAMLDWPFKRIDTTLKKTGYLLMRKDIDSTTSFYEYSEVDRDENTEEKPVNVRSLAYMDVSVRNLESRLITYRTYDKDEYRDMLSYLLSNNYHSTNKFDFKEAKHVIYSNGSREIRVKEITTTLKSGRKFIAYEFELGR
jgi:hypothetical protein